MTNPIYIVYQITNQINNKIYVGVHKTNNPNDSYMGSGKLIKLAIKKHGLCNFTKTILFEYDNKEDAYSKEKEIVNEEYVSKENTYNLNLGGACGRNIEIHRHETREKISISITEWHQINPVSVKTKVKMSESAKRSWQDKHKGYYITPNGKFILISDAIRSVAFISRGTMRKWCNNPDVEFTKRNIAHSLYLTVDDLGKTPRDLGFNFSDGTILAHEVLL